jgi:hypothetical protein
MPQGAIHLETSRNERMTKDFGPGQGKVPRSSIHKILTNPVYCGNFYWAGKLHQGIQEPIVSQDLFDRVQEMLDEKGRRRTRQQKHTWSFQGLVSCGHCDWALTAEINKG